MKMRASHFSVVATLAIVASAQSFAGVITPGPIELVNTATPSPTGATERAFLRASNDMATNLLQSFTLTQAASLSTMRFFGAATNSNLSIIDSMGATASDSMAPLGNVVWKSGLFTTPGGALATKQWHAFDLTGLTLPAGTYYAVMASDDAFGAFWNFALRNDPATHDVGDRGSALYVRNGGSPRVASLNYTLGTTSPFVFGLQVTGAPVPTPGSLAIAATGGVLCLGRRRRR